MASSRCEQPTFAKAPSCNCAAVNLKVAADCAAQEALRRGMESLSQAEVGSALQVYFNLGQLRQVRSAESSLAALWRFCLFQVGGCFQGAKRPTHMRQPHSNFVVQ